MDVRMAVMILTVSCYGFMFKDWAECCTLGTEFQLKDPSHKFSVDVVASPSHLAKK